MSSYVESVLAPGEAIVHRAAVSHWHYALSYLLGLLFIAGGIAAFAVSRENQWLIGGSVALAAGIVVVLVALIRRSTIELVLTDRRIIAKRGFIARDTVEMNLSKVESVRVDQTVLGRLLGYGDVSVVGTGSSLEPLRAISQPLELRRRLGELSQAKAS